MGILRLRVYYAYGYERTWSKATGVLRLQLRTYRGYKYGRATGVLWACGNVQANIWSQLQSGKVNLMID